MKKKNTVVIKERDEWSGLAQLIGNLVAKYAEEIDFDSLPDPDKYLWTRVVQKSYMMFAKERKKRNKEKKDIEFVLMI